MTSVSFHFFQTKKVEHSQFMVVYLLNCIWPTEILLEPITKFKVIEVTKQGIVTVEPVKGGLEDEISPGCVRHIISNLLKYGKGSKDVCDKMCRILCKVNLDDSSSRKTSPAILSEASLKYLHS